MESLFSSHYVAYAVDEEVEPNNALYQFVQNKLFSCLVYKSTAQAMKRR
jgi:hypothetical protein